MRETARLAALLARARWRHTWNSFRARPAGAAGLLAVLALGSSVAYVALFVAAFQVIGQAAGEGAQAAALALMAGAIAAASFGAKASAGEAVIAGSPENEFLLARPISLARLVAARSLAGVVADPFGALFLLPVLMAAAIAWGLPPAAWLVAALTSVCVQFTVAATAQITQMAVVRWLPRGRRAWAWVALRLLAALALACVWMSATWILRTPALLAPRLADLEHRLSFAPVAWLAAPLSAFRREGWALPLLALAPVLAVAVAAGMVAVAVARRAGMHGWEEAGAPWAEGPSGGRGPPRALLTPVRREWRLLVRDRARLAALVALPVILVGVQIFGSIGWEWSTATVGRVAVLTFSVTLYMTTLGPLAHMQAERRAFWILRTVPVSLDRLMWAKAQAWAIILGAMSGGIFAGLAAGVPHAPTIAVVRAGALVVGGAIAMTLLAVGVGCAAADLSDDQRGALGPGAVYLFLLLGALYNVVFVVPGWWGPLAATAYVPLVFCYWRAGMAQVRICLDAEVLARRPFRLADGVTLSVIGVLSPVAIAQALGRAGMSPAVIGAARTTALVVVGVAAAWLLVANVLRSRSAG